HRKKHGETEQDTAGVDQFVEIRESTVPWDPDEPIVREDEQYDRLSEHELFPSEEVVDPRLLPPEP
ncbi:MAG TPA: hypothetical protein VHB98_10165, partial [Chloroflexota bacterium]|nr:hypothetical protein [Chloroflexota bacterium]